MIERVQLFPLNFYKKADFYGSAGKMSFRLAKAERALGEGDEKEACLKGSIWEGPVIYSKTPDDKIEDRFFAFSEEGIVEAMNWFNTSSKHYNSAK